MFFSFQHSNQCKSGQELYGNYKHNFNQIQQVPSQQSFFRKKKFHFSKKSSDMDKNYHTDKYPRKRMRSSSEAEQLGKAFGIAWSTYRQLF